MVKSKNSIPKVKRIINCMDSEEMIINFTLLYSSYCHWKVSMS